MNPLEAVAVVLAAILLAGGFLFGFQSQWIAVAVFALVYLMVKALYQVGKAHFGRKS